MNICVFYQYKVIHKCEFSTLDFDGGFIYDTVNEEFTKSGSELLSILANHINQNETINVSFNTNTSTNKFTITIEEFNSWTGEDSTHTYVISESKEN